MKSRGDAPNYWLLVVCVAAVTFCRGAEARSLRASEASDDADAAALSADNDDDLALDDSQAQDEQTAGARVNVVKEMESQREVRIARMEELGKAEMVTLLRQEKAVETLAKEQATVEAEESALEQTQKRLRKKLEILDHGGHLNASDVEEITAAKDGDSKTSADAEGAKGAKEGTDETSKASTKDGAKESIDDVSKEGTKDGAKETTDESSKEGSKDVAKESTEESSKEASKDGSKEGTEEGTDESTQNSTEESTRKSTLDGAEEEVPSAGTPDRDPVQKFLIQVVYGRDSFISMFSYLVLTFIVAVLYKTLRPTPEKIFPAEQLLADEVHDWHYKVMDCHDCSRDWPICCWAMWCGAVRWADTVSQPHVALMPFWSALIFFEIMSGLTSITIGLTGLILVLVGVYNRQQIRQRYNIPHGTCASLFWDSIAWFCCACCAIAQEARQVDLVEPPSDSFPYGKSPLEMRPQQNAMRPDGSLYAPNRTTPPATLSSPQGSPPPGATVDLQDTGAPRSSRA